MEHGTQENKLWVKVFKIDYLGDSHIFAGKAGNSQSNVWRGVLKIASLLLYYIAIIASEWEMGAGIVCGRIDVQVISP